MNNTTGKTLALNQIFCIKNRYLLLWSLALRGGSCDVICGSKVDKITLVMSWLEPHLNRRNRGFRCLLKPEIITIGFSLLKIGFSLWKLGSLEEIDSGASPLNLVNLKITRTGNIVHFGALSWPQYKDGHAV